MRFITGLIVGVLLTIGTAYVSDATRVPSERDGVTPHMVNWDVVSANMQGLSQGIRDAWARLMGGAQTIDRKIGA